MSVICRWQGAKGACRLLYVDGDDTATNEVIARLIAVQAQVGDVRQLAIRLAGEVRTGEPSAYI